MSSFDLIPKSSFVLLTAPVILYGIIAKKGRRSLPLSSDCQNLLERCYRGDLYGIVTTGIVARTWKVLQSISARVENMEEDPSTARQFKRANPYPFLNKRIAAILRSEVEILTITPDDFGPASRLAYTLDIPNSLALDLAASLRELEIFRRGSKKSHGAYNLLYVALPFEQTWIHSSFFPCWTEVTLPSDRHPF